jgi:Protein of unknown function (DUF2281)
VVTRAGVLRIIESRFSDFKARCILDVDMAVDAEKFEELLRQLPEELQNEVLQFAEALLHKNDEPLSGKGRASIADSIRELDSGDGRSGDNERIDSQLAAE